MRLVVADTSPLNYLILIDEVAILPALFAHVLIPQTVSDELRHDEAPAAVRHWIGEQPAWLEIVPQDDETNDAQLEQLHQGERAAILLAARIGADLLLMDDRIAVMLARSRGLAVTGTLGVLDLAATRGMIRVDEAVERLKRTSFRCRPEVLDALLARQRRR